MSQTESTNQRQVAVVTGGSKGIGREIALHLAQAGFKVCVCGRDAGGLEEVKTFLERCHSDVATFQCDITNMQQVQDLIKHAETTLGPVDIMVNNAGMSYCRSIERYNADEWSTLIDINCKGLVNCVTAVLPGMVERSKGSIINISSVFAQRPHKLFAVYSATKCFVDGFSRAIRDEVRLKGIRVTTIRPALVYTGATEIMAKTSPQEVEQLTSELGFYPVDPVDVARAVVYIATQPDHVNIDEMGIKNTRYAF